MRMNQCKRLGISICVLLCSLSTWASPVNATNEGVNLTVNYVYDGTIIQDTNVDIYLVAEKNGTHYNKTEQFNDLQVNFDNMKIMTSWADEGRVIDKYIIENACLPVYNGVVDAEGKAVFNQMDEGIYFVHVEDMEYKSGTLKSNPVIMTLPLYSNETNEFTYNVEMQPKVDFEKTPEHTKPQSTEPQSTEPQSTEPQSTEPQSTEPQSTEPQSTEPQSTEPESSISEVTDIPDVDVPQTGTTEWLIAPIVVAGSVFLLISICGGHKKDEQ